MSTKTHVEVGDYKGSPVFKIYEIRDDGAKRDVPTISFGVRKAEHILANIEALKKFVNENKNF